MKFHRKCFQFMFFFILWSNICFGYSNASIEDISKVVFKLESFHKIPNQSCSVWPSRIHIRSGSAVIFKDSLKSKDDFFFISSAHVPEISSDVNESCHFVWNPIFGRIELRLERIDMFKEVVVFSMTGTNNVIRHSLSKSALDLNDIATPAPSLNGSKLLSIGYWGSLESPQIFFGQMDSHLAIDGPFSLNKFIRSKVDTISGFSGGLQALIINDKIVPIAINSSQKMVIDGAGRLPKALSETSNELMNKLAGENSTFWSYGVWISEIRSWLNNPPLSTKEDIHLDKTLVSNIRSITFENIQFSEIPCDGSRLFSGIGGDYAGIGGDYAGITGQVRICTVVFSPAIQSGYTWRFGEKSLQEFTQTASKLVNSTGEGMGFVEKLVKGSDEIYNFSLYSFFSYLDQGYEPILSLSTPKHLKPSDKQKSQKNTQYIEARKRVIDIQNLELTSNMFRIFEELSDKDLKRSYLQLSPKFKVIFLDFVLEHLPRKQKLILENAAYDYRQTLVDDFLANKKKKMPFSFSQNSTDFEKFLEPYGASFCWWIESSPYERSLTLRAARESGSAIAAELTSLDFLFPTPIVSDEFLYQALNSCSLLSASFTMITEAMNFSDILDYQEIGKSVGLTLPQNSVTPLNVVGIVLEDPNGLCQTSTPDLSFSIEDKPFLGFHQSLIVRPSNTTNIWFFEIPKELWGVKTFDFKVRFSKNKVQDSNSCKVALRVGHADLNAQMYAPALRSVEPLKDEELEVDDLESVKELNRLLHHLEININTLAEMSR